MSTDPYNPVSAAAFTELRNYVSARNANILTQLPGTVSVDDLPGEPEILSAHPNPFMASTNIQFQLARSGPVRVGVYDARGALVRMLVDGPLEPGAHRAIWEGTDQQGRQVGAGVYFISCQANGRTWSERIALLR